MHSIHPSRSEPAAPSPRSAADAACRHRCGCGGHSGSARFARAAATAVHEVGSIRRVVGLDAVLRARANQQDATSNNSQRAWFYPVPGEPDRLAFNPLIVDNVMYVSGVRGVVVALDATTGKELWMSTLQATDRGLAYWESKDRSDRRLILTASNGIREIDARTGQQILTFGTNGFVDMRVGAPRRNGGPNNSPGRVFENLLIVGSNVGEGYGSPPGDIRAYDVLTGKLVWTFHTIPRPGEYGYETWPRDGLQVRGRREHVGRSHARREERHRLPADRFADARSLRRRSRRATTCSATACSRSTRARESGCGISRSCITICGTTTTPRRRSC